MIKILKTTSLYQFPTMYGHEKLWDWNIIIRIITGRIIEEVWVSLNLKIQANILHQLFCVKNHLIWREIKNINTHDILVSIILHNYKLYNTKKKAVYEEEIDEFCVVNSSFRIFEWKI